MKSHADLIFSNPSDIADYDVDLWQAMQDESIRQEDHIELIASENYASKRVLEALSFKHSFACIILRSNKYYVIFLPD